VILELIAGVAVAALSLALGVAVGRRGDVRRLRALELRASALEADHAAVPTEVRAARSGAIASEMDERRKAHDLRNRVVGYEERIDRIDDRLKRLEGDVDPADTLTGGRRNDA
jgi:hypothetical protein